LRTPVARSAPPTPARHSATPDRRGPRSVRFPWTGISRNDPRRNAMNLPCRGTRTRVRHTVLCALLPGLLLSAHAQAATVCVGTAGQFNSAIIAAETNDESDDIRIRAGTYVAPIPDGFYYYPPSNDADISNVTVSGGWNADCSVATNDATRTVLSGNLQTSVLRFRNANGTITVRNLTITGGYSDGVVLGALHFDHGSGFGIGVHVE